MKQIERNLIDPIAGFLRDLRFLIHEFMRVGSAKNFQRREFPVPLNSIHSISTGDFAAGR